jgi:hypothetical protein
LVAAEAVEAVAGLAQTNALLAAVVQVECDLEAASQLPQEQRTLLLLELVERQVQVIQ